MRQQPTVPSNHAIAKALSRLAKLLRAQRAPADRVESYQAAARCLHDTEVSVGVLLATSGRSALGRLPDVDERAASAIEEFASRQRIGLLDRLEGKLTAEELFGAVPGLAGKRAHLIHETLDIETLEDLELAAFDGRLLTVPGVGPKLVAALRTHLGSILSHSARCRSRDQLVIGTELAPAPEASVAMLLELDAEYREKAARDELPCIAPKRFNEAAASWLPILHAARGGWDCTLSFANTARAHRLGKTRDWVEIVYSREGVERQCTVVTTADGELAGRRVVRGREAESASDTLVSGLIAVEGGEANESSRSGPNGALL